MVFYNISHNIFGIISSKYFMLCFLIYCIVFHNVLRYVYHSICLKYFMLFFLIYFTKFVNIASNLNVPYAGQSLSHCFLRALFRTAIARRLLAALLAMPAPASSSARFSLIIAHSVWCCGFRLGVEYLTTALVHLYCAGTSREKRYYALLALFS